MSPYLRKLLSHLVAFQLVITGPSSSNMSVVEQQTKQDKVYQIPDGQPFPVSADCSLAHHRRHCINPPILHITGIVHFSRSAPRHQPWQAFATVPKQNSKGLLVNLANDLI